MLYEIILGRQNTPVSPPIFDQGLSPWKTEQLYEMDSEEYLSAVAGVGQRIKLEAAPPFNKGACERVFRSIGGNAFLILGRDRAGKISSGYGGLADNRASSAIRLTAGMGGKDVREVSKDGKSLGLNPNNQIDAATIYLSQKTNIDDEEVGFNLKDGTIGAVTARSGVAMKADSVRIISGDGGIKFITSANSINSQGGKVEEYADINFICGNDDSLLQPIVKGENMRIAIDKIFTYMSLLTRTLNGVVQQQNKFNIALKSHVHQVPPVMVPPMSTTPGNGTGAVTPAGTVQTMVTGISTIPAPPFPVGFGPGAGLTQANLILEAIGTETVTQFTGITSQRLVALNNRIWSANKNHTQNNSSKLYLLSKNVHST